MASVGPLRYIGFGILFSNATPSPGLAPSSQKDDSDLDFALMPLAFPSLAGPGTMAVVMSMTTQLAIAGRD